MLRKNMLFILWFACCSMLIPLAFDIHKNGRNNIVVRAWRDVKNYSWYQKTVTYLKKF